ncbi:MAG: hypothetical protein HWN68_07455 [Desulfobacterales bacterium]|nr:hypothetical protein [Desulfobacterales bacterium]
MSNFSHLKSAGGGRSSNLVLLKLLLDRFQSGGQKDVDVLIGVSWRRQDFCKFIKACGFIAHDPWSERGPVSAVEASVINIISFVIQLW